jgi:ParB/RepB/Spo0J family partition protein
MAKLTPARRAGLEVLAKWHPQPVAYSNSTDSAGLVYWQTANWLAENGHVDHDKAAGELRLTEVGLGLCRSEGIALPDEGSPTVATITADPTDGTTLAKLPIDALVPSPGNLRRDLGDIDGLAASVKADGILQPLLVTPDFPAPDRWMVLAGHRRLAAAKVAGLGEVPCMIREAVPEDGRVATFLVENLRRDGLAALEEAEGYRHLVALGWSQRKISEHVGCSQPHVSKRLALLDLPEDLRARVDLPAKDGKHITLEEAAELHKLLAHPAMLKKASKPGANVASAVEQAQLEIKWRAAVAKLLADAAERGWPIRKPKEWSDKASYSTLGQYKDLAVDAKKHEGEPCHAVVEPKDHGVYRVIPSSLEAVCVDPKRHAKKGQSKLKVKPKPKHEDPWDVQQREERAGRKAAADARLSALIALVARPPRNATDVVLRSFVEVAGFENAKIACELLELDYTQEPYESWEQPTRTLGTWADAYPVEAAYALVVARREEYARRSTSGIQPELYELLEPLGYTPTEWEAGVLAERAEAEAKMAARDAELAAPDPAEDRPEGAVAWYHGWPEDDDPARWLTDVGEAETIAGIHPGRVIILVADDAGGIVECRECGCTDARACAGGCSWVEADLCSACVPETADAPLTAAAG